MLNLFMSTSDSGCYSLVYLFTQSGVFSNMYFEQVCDKIKKHLYISIIKVQVKTNKPTALLAKIILVVLIVVSLSGYTMGGYTVNLIHKKGILEEGLNFVLKPILPTKLLINVKQVLER